MKLSNNLTFDNVLESIKLSHNGLFSKQQIKALVDGHNEGVNIRAYSDPRIPDTFMYPIRQTLRQRGNPSDCEAFKEKMIEYIYDGYNISQIEELAKGILNGIDESLYASKSFRGVDMHIIRINLERGVNVLPYMRQKFTLEQIGEIADGLFLGLDVSCYTNKDFTPQQMRLIRIGLEEGLDAKQYADPTLSDYEMNCRLDELRHPIIIGEWYV